VTIKLDSKTTTMRMIRRILLGSALVCMSAASTIPPALAPLIEAQGNDTLPGEYIITLKDDSSLAQHFDAIGRDLRADDSVALFKWFPHANAYHATNLTANCIDQIRRDPGVRTVLETEHFSMGGSPVPPAEDTPSETRDQDNAGDKLRLRSTGIWFPEQIRGAPWHLQALSAGQLISNLRDWAGSAYQMYYNQGGGSGQGVNVYVVDSGVNTGHPKFGGRAVNFTKGYACGDGSCFMDYVGHGTAVAGLVGGKLTGTAQGATIVNVKAFFKNSKGKSSTNQVWLVNALQDILSEHLANLQNPPAGWTGSVVNLSWGREYTPDASIGNLINSMYYAGITVVAGAGNDRDKGGNADNMWPCNMNTICVGAINSAYLQDWYSNPGGNVTVFAPGTNVYTLDNLSGDILKHTGTSMATPLVAGIIATFVGWESLRTGCVDDVNKARARLGANMLTGQLSDSKNGADLGGSSNNLALSGINNPNKGGSQPYAGVGQVVESSVTYSEYNPFGIGTVTGAISLYGMAATMTSEGPETTDTDTSSVAVDTSTPTNISDDDVVWEDSSTTMASDTSISYPATQTSDSQPTVQPSASPPVTSDAPSPSATGGQSPSDTVAPSTTMDISSATSTTMDTSSATSTTTDCRIIGCPDNFYCQTNGQCHLAPPGGCRGCN